MPLTPRQNALLSFLSFDQALHRAQAANRRAAWAFGEFDITASLSHIVSLAGELRNAHENCEKIVALIEEHFPPITRQKLPKLDAVLGLLELSRDAFNHARTFPVAQHQTNSQLIAQQLDEIIQQLGGDANA